ncbi:transposase [Pelovirga terrestris]|uniref:Transposase n=1 Tax=Pelovirga terrestris TaxID=2771352 RepID=A0A8J6QYW8_9BACT|nr:transposase [Pelovirga terrestris]MBD1401613.1 transposase [Pelovirga terrestris]
MPRSPRLVVEGESAVYHLMSRTALDGFVLGDAEKDHLLQVIRHFTSIYFADVLGFCIMGNHFHLVVRMHPDEGYSDTEIQRRYALYYQDDETKDSPLPGQIAMLRYKWQQLSEMMKEIKQSFSRYYNKRHNRRGFFWGERFKSVLVEDGDTLINCLAYVDLNPIRAGLVARPDDYRWSSLGYHSQMGNRSRFLSLDFGLVGAEKLSVDEQLRRYRQFVYEVGALPTDKGAHIDGQIVTQEQARNYTKPPVDRFLSRSRYFTDSVIIGSRDFVRTHWRRWCSEEDNPDKNPVAVRGLEDVFSLRRLTETLGR